MNISATDTNLNDGMDRSKPKNKNQRAVARALPSAPCPLRIKHAALSPNDEKKRARAHSSKQGHVSSWEATNLDDIEDLL
jgi:hypothetical protein